MKAGRTHLRGLFLWLIAVALIALGYHLSIERVLDQQWLARAGCLVVVLGIWSAIGGVVEERMLLESLEVRRRMLTAALRRRYRGDEDERERRLDAINKRHAERVEAVKNQFKFSVGVVEASLLITGTLLWGFGDLIRFVG